MSPDPRALLVEHAHADLERLVWDWIKRNDLTYNETIRCLREVTDAMCQLRAELHPQGSGRKTCGG